MKKLLFVHDARVSRDYENNYYTDGSYNNSIWDRYLRNFDALSILMRKDRAIYSPENANRRLNKVDSSKMSIHLLEDQTRNVLSYLNLSRKIKNRKIIRNAVRCTDYLVARLPSSLGNIAVNYAIRYHKPYLLEVVGCTFDSLWNYNWKGKILSPFAFLKMRFIVKRAPYIIYVTNRFLQRRYPCSQYSVNISNVMLEYVDESILTSRLERIVKKNGKQIILGTAAAVNVPYKGQEYVIKAIAKLKAGGVNSIEYQMIGGGDQSYLRNISKELGVMNQVTFLGAIPHENVFSWMDNIDIYIQPSFQEGLPRSVIEAMSRGVPCIGSDVAGIPELLDSHWTFNRRGNIENQIVKMILEMDQGTMQSQAGRNFMEAKKYSMILLESKRDDFFSMFKEAKL